MGAVFASRIVAGMAMMQEKCDACGESVAMPIFSDGSCKSACTCTPQKTLPGVKYGPPGPMRMLTEPVRICGLTVAQQCDLRLVLEVHPFPGVNRITVDIPADLIDQVRFAVQLSSLLRKDRAAPPPRRPPVQS